jgi:hypothetical protein
MKTLVSAALASLTLLGAAAPALAQPMYDHPHGPPPAAHGWDLDRRIDWMQDRINRGRADGSLDWREARRVQHELGRIRFDEHRMRAHDGGWLTDPDRAMLQDRLDRLGEQIHWMRQNDFHHPW